MHPYVIGRGYRMLALEDLVDKLAKDGAVFMTMEQAAEEAKAKLFRLGRGASAACVPLRRHATCSARIHVLSAAKLERLAVKRREFLALLALFGAVAVADGRYGSARQARPDRRSSRSAIPILRPS